MGRRVGAVENWGSVDDGGRVILLEGYCLGPCFSGTVVSSMCLHLMPVIL